MNNITNANDQNEKRRLMATSLSNDNIHHLRLGKLPNFDFRY